MIRRALRLKYPVSLYMESDESRPIKHFALDSSEWRQLEYLCDLLSPFYVMTTSVSEQQGPSVHKVFDVYETLFDHLESSIELLQQKKISWKERLCHGLQQAHEKLRAYYSKTYQDEGYLYAIATILNPASKLKIFSSASWIDDGTDWVQVYQRVLTKIFEYYKQKNPSIAVESVYPPNQSTLDRARETIRKKRRTVRTQPTPTAFAEIESYLDEGMFPSHTYQRCILTPLNLGTRNESIAEYWQANKKRFPILALMAQDFLAIATTGVGVERLFNSARDICTYRRGRLHADTINGLMLQLTTDQFRLKEEYRVLNDDEEEDTKARVHEEVELDGDECDYISDGSDGENDATDESPAQSCSHHARNRNQHRDNTQELPSPTRSHPQRAQKRTRNEADEAPRRTRPHRTQNHHRDDARESPVRSRPHRTRNELNYKVLANGNL